MRLSGQPHHLGSPGGRANAEWIRDQFRAWGWTADIEVFHVLFPVPKLRRLELLAPDAVRGEAAGAGRFPVTRPPPSAAQLPTYNAYSIDGDVTAPLVYVNYGIPADYERLERMGISVKGAIVIAKYGQSWRGIKPKVAAEHGAIGCILYSDPNDDGYHAGDIYPKGGMRPADGVQRGSVMDMPVRTGDPLTPNVGATDSAKRLDRSEAETLTRIPVLPISWSDAQPLLAAIGGRVAPGEWQGGLPFTYHVGPGPARVQPRGAVRLAAGAGLRRHCAAARQPWSRTSGSCAAITMMPGSTVRPIRCRGSSAELEEARAWAPCIGRDGVRGARSSTPPGTAKSRSSSAPRNGPSSMPTELRPAAVAYLNSDVNDRGFLDLSGSHVLERLLNQVANADRRSGDRPDALSDGCGSRASANARRAGDRADIRGRPTCASRRSGPDPISPPSSSTSASRRANLGFGGEQPGSGGRVSLDL